MSTSISGLHGPLNGNKESSTLSWAVRAHLALLVLSTAASIFHLTLTASIFSTLSLILRLFFLLHFRRRNRIATQLNGN